MLTWIYTARTGEQENPTGPQSGEEGKEANFIPRWKEGYSQELMSKHIDDEFEML